MQRRYVDRSRVETYQRCPRSRYWEYEHQTPGGRRGITSARKPLPLAVGGAVHSGLEVLLREGNALAVLDSKFGVIHINDFPNLEDRAVAAALADLASYRAGGLALDATEQAGLTPKASVTAIDDFDAQLAAQAKELGMDLNDPALASLRQRDPRTGASAFDDYLWTEQSALVEGMVRAYSRRRLRPLLAEYEVLEVEREGEWLLSDATVELNGVHERVLTPPLWFMSRPDALLRSRADNSLYLQSFKTAASWDVRKARDAEHDMQGLSEGIEVERRLGEWWGMVKVALDMSEPQAVSLAAQDACDAADISGPMIAYLRALPAPPRILGVRMEYLLKSDRWKDKDLSARFGLDVRSQRSVLIRAYQSTKDASSLNAEWDHVRDDGTAGKLAWQTWKSRPVWECGLTVRQWIDRLDASEVAMSAYDSTTGLEPRELGWHSEAQATGYLTGHPLDAVFVPPIIIYRNSDSLLDLVEQMEHSERRIADAVADLVACGDDEGAIRSSLNRNWPMTLKACEYPSTCQFVPLCHGGEDVRRAPLESGMYTIRTYNHPQESGANPVDSAQK